MQTLDARKAWTQLVLVGGLIALALAVGCGGGQPVSTDSEFEPFRTGQPKRRAQVTLSGVNLAELVELKTAPGKSAFAKIRATVKLCETDNRCSSRQYEVQYGRSHRFLEFKTLAATDRLWAGDLRFLLAEAGTDPQEFRDTLTGLLEVQVVETGDAYQLSISGVVVLAHDRDSRDGRTVESKVTSDSGQIPVKWESSLPKPNVEEDCTQPCSLDGYGRIPQGT